MNLLLGVIVTLTDYKYTFRYTSGRKFQLAADHIPKLGCI